MTSPGRCPTCGYVLRYSMIGYACDFCGLRGKLPISNMIASLERSLRDKVQNFLQPKTNIAPFQRCSYCGFIFPTGGIPCPKCGRNLEKLTPLEKLVFDYISSHEGTISLSQAAQDLALSPKLLSQTIEQLKAIGILKQS